MEDRLLNVRDAAAYLGLHRSTLDHWRVEKPRQGPTFTRVGIQIRYRLSDLHAFLDAAEGSADPTSIPVIEVRR